MFPWSLTSSTKLKEMWLPSSRGSSRGFHSPAISLAGTRTQSSFSLEKAMLSRRFVQREMARTLGSDASTTCAVISRLMAVS